MLRSFLLAHPLLESTALPVPPVAVATLAMVLVAGATRLPRRDVVRPPAVLVRDGTGPWRSAWLAGRMPILVLLLLLAAAGRLGADRATENIAPIAVVALGWPVLLLLAVLLPGIWAWIDPWDTIARPIAGDVRGDARDTPDTPDPLGEPVDGGARNPHDAGDAPDAVPAPARSASEAVDVRPAVAVAVAWTWYLGAFGATFSPRAVGTALIGYAMAVSLAAALGGRAWVERTEAFGLLASWAGLLRARQLSCWRPPRGAEIVCGALIGGLIFGALRLSGVWFLLPGQAASTAALLLACVAAAALLRTAERVSSARGAAGAAAVAAVPIALATAVATAMTNDRMWIAVQLLPSVLDDPLGRGWGLLGGMEPAVSSFPLGAAGRVVIQIAVLVAGGVAGAAAASSRSRTAAGPAVFAAALLVGIGTLAVSAL